MGALFCIFDLGQNFDFKKLSTLLLCKFFSRSDIFETNGHFFQKFESLLEVQRAKRKFSENLCHNILELYNILVKI